MQSYTTVDLKRDCEATQIPSGNVVQLPAGTTVDITQTLGGSVTVRSDSGLYRIEAKDADALGVLEKAEKVRQKEGPVDETEVWEVLRSCYDPEIPVNIVDLGLVYDCRLIKKGDGGTRVEVKMTLTAPGCGMGPAIAHDAQAKILSIDGVDEADVQLVWDPPWNQNMISEAGRMKLGMI